MGNIGQINRSVFASGVLTIFNITPHTVATGATITIQGQRFNAAPSLNIVVASELNLSLPHYGTLEHAAQGSGVLNIESRTAKDQARSAPRFIPCSFRALILTAGSFLRMVPLFSCSRQSFVRSNLVLPYCPAFLRHCFA